MKQVKRKFLLMSGLVSILAHVFILRITWLHNPQYEFHSNEPIYSLNVKMFGEYVDFLYWNMIALSWSIPVFIILVLLFLFSKKVFKTMRKASKSKIKS